jgi:hypothetical protein
MAVFAPNYTNRVKFKYYSATRWHVCTLHIPGVYYVDDVVLTDVVSDYVNLWSPFVYSDSRVTEIWKCAQGFDTFVPVGFTDIPFGSLNVPAEPNNVGATQGIISGGSDTGKKVRFGMFGLAVSFSTGTGSGEQNFVINPQENVNVVNLRDGLLTLGLRCASDEPVSWIRPRITTKPNDYWVRQLRKAGV